MNMQMNCLTHISVDMSNTKITFYPVKNGDTNLIEFSDGAIMLIDCKFRSEAEEDNDDYDVINDLLTNKLKTKEKGLPYLNAFVLTHPDQDHCLGFAKKFFLNKNPETAAPTKEEKDSKLILVGELWYSPRVFTEHEDDLSEDAKSFKKEAERRMKLWKNNDATKNKPGNRIRIIGYSDVDDLNGIPDECISAAGDEICKMDGKERTKYRFFIHSPFKNSIEGDSRNETSIVMQIRVDADGSKDAGKLFFGGDAEWRVWKKIQEKTSDIKNLEWNLFEAPHHCSYTFFSDDRDSEPEESSLNFLDNRVGNGYIVSSSKTIKKNNDNPPCQKAKNRYIQKLDDDDDYFKCTEENEKQDPVVFEIKSDGIWFDDGSKKKKQESKSSSIGKREHLYG